MFTMFKNNKRFVLSIAQAREIVSKQRAKTDHISRLLDDIETEGINEDFPNTDLSDYFIDTQRWEPCMRLDRTPAGRPPWWAAAAAATDRAD